MKREHSQRGRRGGHGSRWRTAAALIGLALLVAAGAAAAQVYKWKDAKGVTHYGDTAPPQGAQVLKAAPASAPAAPASAPDPAANLPYELARAVRQYPVTLYTGARCEACERGRSLLRERGVPFTEKTVATQEDQQQLRRLSGSDRLPLLLVGSRRETGLKAASWQEMLDSAAYPRRNMLPSGYRYAAAESAATSAPAPAATTTAPVRAQLKMPPDEAAAQAQAAQPRTPAREKAPPAGNAPPNFQF